MEQLAFLKQVCSNRPACLQQVKEIQIKTLTDGFVLKCSTGLSTKVELESFCVSDGWWHWTVVKTVKSQPV